MDMEEEPLCGVCNHHHHQGIKCSVCGHKGRCNIFPKMKARAAELRKLTVSFYDAGSLQDGGQWDMLVLMRNIVYCSELGIPTDEEFVAQQEAACRHFVGYLGDAPVLCGRYHIAKTPQGQDAAMVDRFAVLPEFRSRGLGKLGLAQLAEDVRLATSGAAKELMFVVPANSALCTKALSMGLRDCATAQMRGGVGFATLAMACA